MTLNLDPQDFLRLRSARNATIEVLEGAVWVTEAGRDACLASGNRYRVRGDGLVLVGADAAGGSDRARVSVTRAGWAWLRGFIAGLPGRLATELRARRTMRELHDLSDHMLRDIGLHREQLDSFERIRRTL